MNTAKKKILLVDDNASITQVMSHALTAAGYEILIENDSTRALQAAQAFRPDLAILDVDMPCMDGGDVMQQIRGHKSLSGMPIIFLTGLASKSDMEIRPEDSIETVLAKPISIADLKIHIEAKLNRST